MRAALALLLSVPCARGLHAPRSPLHAPRSPPLRRRSALRSPPLGRRSALCGGFGLLCPVGGRAARAEEDGPPFTKMDVFQLKASYNGLGAALQAWNVEVAQVQLGNEPGSVVAVSGLNDVQLTHFAAVSAAGVAAFKLGRDEMLQELYLARGAARYEKDPAVALDYIAKAKASAEAARAALGDIAAAASVELGAARAAAAAPEQAITFTPRAAPKVENRLTF